MLKKIYESTNLVQTIAPIQEIITMKGLYIVVTGTAGADDFGRDDIGRILLEKGGKEIINADAEFLQIHQEVMGGHPEFTHQIGACSFGLYIPFRANDRNVMTFVPADNAVLKIDHRSGLATALDSAGKVTVYADVDRGVQLYDMKYVQYSYSLSDGQEMPIDIQQDNIIMSMISDSTGGYSVASGSSNLATIQTEIDEYNSRVSIGHLIYFTADQFKLETTFTDAVVNFIADGDFTSRLSDAMKLNLSSSGGVATPEVLVVSAQFDPNRTAKTKNAQVERLKLLTDRKTAFGKENTVKAINQLRNFS